MHDPMTVAFEIPSYRARRRWPRLPHLLTVWHVDPERDGTDDSCGWFMRPRHGDPATLDRIVADFRFEWVHGSPDGWFGKRGEYNPHGEPNYSPQAIALGMFRIAANRHFGHWSGRADRFLRRHLHDVLHFAENPCDSLCTLVRNSYHDPNRDGPMRERDHEDRIRRAAGCVYSWVLRADRPWWRHPRWHFWHWRLQVHPLKALRRRLLSRCSACGKPFARGESPVGVWDEPPPRWFEAFRGERCLYHSVCHPANRQAGGDRG